MNPNPVGAPEYMPMILLEELSGAEDFRRLGTPAARRLANAMDNLNAASTAFNETAQVLRWAQQLLAEGVDISFSKRRFNDPGYRPVYGATPPPGLPATPPDTARLPLDASHAQPPGGPAQQQLQLPYPS
jgi:hypothetical protein